MGCCASSKKGGGEKSDDALDVFSPPPPVAPPAVQKGQAEDMLAAYMNRNVDQAPPDNLKHESSTDATQVPASTESQQTGRARKNTAFKENPFLGNPQPTPAEPYAEVSTENTAAQSAAENPFDAAVPTENTVAQSAAETPFDADVSNIAAQPAAENPFDAEVQVQPAAENPFEAEVQAQPDEGNSGAAQTAGGENPFDGL